jgi:energy-coupling factor transport system ATP-binding protein
MAMKPEVLVLDEAAALLDPEGRRDVLAAVRKLNGDGVTIVAIVVAWKRVETGRGEAKM